jgi:hypothetical protein
VTGRVANRGWAQTGLHAGLLLVGLGLLQVAAERTNHRFDLTALRELSLAPVTEQVLREVTAPMRVTVFHQRGRRAAYATLLQRMQMAAPSLRYEVLDLDRHPERARVLGVARYGQAAIEYHDRRVVVTAESEEQLVGGVVRVLRGRMRHIMFTAGHGERRPGGDGTGFGRLAAALDAENARVETMSLRDGDVPAGTDLVVVAGPRHDLLPGEVARLEAWIAQGGALLLLLEPGPLPQLERLLGRLGIRAGADVVIDPERSVLGTDGMAAVVELFKRGNPISEPGGRSIETGVVLPSARSVDVVADVPGVAAQAFARTAPTAWTMGDVDRARRGEAPSEAAGDRPGGAPVMVMAEVGEAAPDRRLSRIVVIGDADFASDAYLDLLGNRDLVLNAIAWLSEETALAGERTTRVGEVFRPLSPLVLTEAQTRALLLGLTLGQPGIVLLAGLVVVGRRRRAG